MYSRLRPQDPFVIVLFPMNHLGRPRCALTNQFHDYTYEQYYNHIYPHMFALLQNIEKTTTKGQCSEYPVHLKILLVEDFLHPFIINCLKPKWAINHRVNHLSCEKFHFPIFISDKLSSLDCSLLKTHIRVLQSRGGGGGGECSYDYHVKTCLGI